MRSSSPSSMCGRGFALPSRKNLPFVLALVAASILLYFEIHVSTTLTVFDDRSAAAGIISGERRRGEERRLFPKDGAQHGDGGGLPCDAAAFREYYQRLPTTTTTTLKTGNDDSGVPFGSECLKRLIDAEPRDLRLRIAHVRRRYYERMTESYMVGGGRRRHLFYLCRSAKTCGGLGDRLRGMGRTFYLALMTDASYGAFVEGGARWDAYFRPSMEREEDGEKSGGVVDFAARRLLERRGWKEEYVNDASFRISERFQVPDDEGKDKVGGIDDAGFSLPVSSWSSRGAVVTLRDELSAANFYAGSNATRTMDWDVALFPSLAGSNTDTDTVSNATNDDDAVTFLETNLMLGELTRNPRFAETFRDYRIDDLTNAQLYHVYLALYASRPTEALERAARHVWEEERPMPNAKISSTEAEKHEHENLRNTKKRTYTIGIQLRLGSNGEGVPWKDPKRHSRFVVPCALKQALDLCADAKKDDEEEAVECRAFVTSDSPTAVHQIATGLRNNEAFSSVVFSDGPAIHIDKARLHPEDAFDLTMGTFVDWYLLASKSDAFVLSRSGFSFMASAFRTDDVGNVIDVRPAQRLLDEKELYMKQLRGEVPRGVPCAFREWNGTYSDADYFSMEYPAGGHLKNI